MTRVPLAPSGKARRIQKNKFNAKSFSYAKITEKTNSPFHFFLFHFLPLFFPLNQKKLSIILTSDSKIFNQLKTLNRLFNTFALNITG